MVIEGFSGEDEWTCCMSEQTCCVSTPSGSWWLGASSVAAIVRWWRLNLCWSCNRGHGVEFDQVCGVELPGACPVLLSESLPG